MKNNRLLDVSEIDKLILYAESISVSDLQVILNNRLQRYINSLLKSESVKSIDIVDKNTSRKRKALFFKKFDKEKQLYFADVSPFFKFLNENEIRYSKVYMTENVDKQTFLNADLIQNLENETKILSVTLKVIDEMNITNFKEENNQKSVNVYILEDREVYKVLEEKLKNGLNVIFLKEYDSVQCFIVYKTAPKVSKQVLNNESISTLMKSQKALKTAKSRQIQILNYKYEKQIENNKKIKTKKGVIHNEI